MKQYKYKINGNLYNVTVNDIEENIARVEVNGTPYTVEMENRLRQLPNLLLVRHLLLKLQPAHL
jgi:hypothetical protein